MLVYQQFLIVFFLFSVVRPFDNNVNYPGYDLVQYTGISSILDCQTKCLNYAGCSYFTIPYNLNTCYLKNGMPRAGDSNYVSGPKMDYLYQGNLDEIRLGTGYNYSFIKVIKFILKQIINFIENISTG